MLATTQQLTDRDRTINQLKQALNIKGWAVKAIESFQVMKNGSYQVTFVNFKTGKRCSTFVSSKALHDVITVEWKTNTTGITHNETQGHSYIFNINSLRAEIQEIKLVMPDKTISSRWANCANNKHFQAIKDSIPAHKQAIDDNEFISADIRERRVFTMKQIQLIHQHPLLHEQHPDWQKAS